MYKFRDYQNLALAGSLILAGFGIWYVINDILSDPIIFQSSRSDLRLANADQIYGFWKIVALNRNGEIEREDDYLFYEFRKNGTGNLKLLLSGKVRNVNEFRYELDDSIRMEMLNRRRSDISYTRSYACRINAREDSLFMMTGNSEQYLEFMKEDYASNLLELQK